MLVTRACLITLAACALAACPAEEPEPLKLRVTSEALTDGAKLDSLRVLFWQDGQRFPIDAAAEAFNYPLGDALDPVARRVVLEIDYGKQTFAEPLVVAQVTGRIAGVPRTLWEGTVNLASRTLVDVPLALINPACDADQDGFLACSVQGCCPAEAALPDCGPDDPTTHPWILEEACESCDDKVDNDCDGQDLECIDDDGDTVADCLELDCGLGDPLAAPGLVEVCDDIDNDCDGETDEDVTVIYKDATIGKGDPCGTGACAGGQGVCAAGGVVCSTADQEAAEDICDDGFDNDCDGFTDEGCSVEDADGDGQKASDGDCDDYDSAFYDGAPEPCCLDALRGAANLLARCDRDCDGTVTHCAADDLDGDGASPPDDCDDTDPLVRPGAEERCGDGVDQDCLAGDVACDGLEDGDGDGWSPPADCDDSDDAVYPGAPETCDGRDESCDGIIDDGNPDTAGSAACEETEGECEAGTRVCVNVPGSSGNVQCLGFVPAAPELCDALDNDCDGDTDEDFPDLGDACDGDDADVCVFGTLTCREDGAAVECVNEEPAGLVDTCDGFDNDCDGIIDGGCAAQACGDLSIACPAGFACVDGACADAGGRNLVFVPPGEALMGCTPEQGKCASDAQPQHAVKLGAFAIDRFEVSCGAFCGDAACAGAPAPQITSWCANNEAWPLAYVTWAEAQAWCQSNGGDLCTEAQWERAARTSLTGGVYDAGLRTYAWGEALPECGVNAEYLGSSGAGCSDGAPSPVDSLPAGVSFFGAANMTGNIAEWVLDWHSDTYFAASPLEDPLGPEEGSSKVARGSNWKRGGSDLPAYIRVPVLPDLRDDKFGARCCYPVPDPDHGL